MRGHLLAAIAIAAMCAACDQPIAAVPTLATGTKDLVVCWRNPDAGDNATSTSVSTAVRKRLRGAGYQVVTAGVCEFWVSWDLEWRGHTSEFDDSYRQVTVILREAGGELLDKVKLEFSAGELPASDSDRVAILIVNAVNASPKLATFAEQNGTPAPPAKGDPFGKSTREKPF